MCGFAGLVALNGSGVDRAAVERMSAAIRHRGPDDDGTYFSDRVGFGFRRLSILDLTPSGHQPMEAPDGSAVIVFNGEIYNFVELREELEAKGHAFRSTGDTEVLLTAYREWGTDCLRRLNGMFAFLIHDVARGVVFGARDRFGEKPLFFHRSGNHVLFASEIKAIRATGLVEPETNWAIAAEFLLQQRIDEPHNDETFYKDVFQLPPAGAVELKLDGSWRTWRYWSLDDVGSERVADPAEEFAELFEESVRLRMRSDVPVGVCLSGGLDSTAIACAIGRQRSADPDASVGEFEAFCYHSPEFDESRYVADTLAQTGAHMNRLLGDAPRLWGLIDTVLWYHDEPVHSLTAFVGFELMRLARERNIPVLLNGQGADETLAGYSGYFNSYWYTLIASGRMRQARREIRAYCDAHGGDPKRLFWAECNRVVRQQMGRIGLYRAMARRRRVHSVRQNDWFTKEFKDQLPMREQRYGAGLDDSLRHSVDVAPLPLYLRIEDRNAMAHSIEGRLPFLDHRLVEMAFRLPPDWKVRGSLNKYVLRESMRGRIPESVRAREDKMGFPVGFRTWLKTILHDEAKEFLARPELRERGIYDVDAMVRDLERHRAGEIDIGDQFFAVVQFETFQGRCLTRG